MNGNRFVLFQRDHLNWCVRHIEKCGNKLVGTKLIVGSAIIFNRMASAMRAEVRFDSMASGQDSLVGS